MYPAPTPVVRSLLILNIFIFAIITLPLEMGVRLPWAWAYEGFMLPYWTNPELRVYQLLTHFFHHANLSHIFFNMLMLYFFGPVIEGRIGPQKFLTLYLVAAAGAVLLHTGEIWWQIEQDFALQTFGGQSPEASRMLGASGAISGTMAAFAVFYPWEKLYFFFIPVGIAAVYMIGGIFLLDLFMGVMDYSFDSTARFAHVGGGIAGAIMAFIYKKTTPPPHIQQWN